jgi:predicted metal-dependent peptidase
MREPLLLLTLLSHRFAANDTIKALRSGKGMIEYNPAYLEGLSEAELEEKLKVETVRLLLRHPYRKPPQNDPALSLIASNITLNEFYAFKELPGKAPDYWDDPAFRKQNYEFYYRELKSLGEGSESGEDAEEAALWDDDDYMDQKMKGMVSQAALNKTWGSLPGELVETLVASLHPAVDYRKILRGFRAMVLSGEKVLTRTKQSRRYGPLYLGRKNQFTTRLLIGVDVSGSISGAELGLFYSAMNRFFYYGVNSLEVLQFDTRIQGEPVLMRKARKAIGVTGRGGTSFQPLFNYFSGNHKNYDGLIVFTDGFGPIPQLAPAIARKTLWVCNSKANYERHCGWMGKLGRCCWIE